MSDLLRDVRALMRRTRRLEREIRATSRASQAAHRSIEAGAMPVYDEQGTLRQIIGVQADGTYTVTDHDGPTPPTPTVALVEARPGALSITWDGETDNGDPLPADFARVEVYLTTTPGVVDDQPRGRITAVTGGAVTVAHPPGLVYVHLVTVSTSGVASALSAPVAATSLLVGADDLTAGATGLTVPNGNFEEAALSTLFAGWRPSTQPLGDVARIEEAVGGDALCGSRSLRIACDSGTHGLRVVTDKWFSVRAGQTLTVSAVVSADRALTAPSGSPLAELTVMTSTGAADPEEIGSPGVVWHAADGTQTDSLTVDLFTMRGTVTIPVGHKMMRVAVSAWPSGGAGWAARWDDVRVTVADPPDDAQVTQSLIVTGAAILGFNDLSDPSGLTLHDYIRQVIASAGGAAAPDTLTIPLSASRWYDETGARKDAGAPEIRLGDRGDSDGNRRGAVWWDTAAAAAAMAGHAYTIVEARVTMTAHAKAIPNLLHIGTHTDATVRATWGDITGKAPAALEAGTFRVGTTKWVDITSIVTPAAIASGAVKGLLFGPAPTESMDYAVTIGGRSATSTDAPYMVLRCRN